LETASQPEGWASIAQELAFMNDRPLLIRDGDDTLRVRGFIDRVDAAPDGRLRVVDYKTGGPDDYKPQALAEGKKLQMAIYGLALRDALGRALPAEGFYWHILKAVASPLTLKSYPGGPEVALADGLAAIWRAVRAARAGQFTPQAPAGGCPDYCPAAGFCWHYRARAWGEG
jgi:putative RecB family exonuclease